MMKLYEKLWKFYWNVFGKLHKLLSTYSVDNFFSCNSRCELSRRNNFRKRHKEAIFQGTMVILKKEMDQQNVMWTDEMMCLATPDILFARTATKMLASWGLIVRGCFTGGVLPCLTIVNGTLTALTCQEVIECDLTQI